MFDFFKEELNLLSELEESGEIALWYGDETAFHQNPTAVRAWQHPGYPLSLPATRGSVMNVLGFVRKNNESVFYEYQGAMESKTFLLLMEDFIKGLNKEKKNIIVLDRASVHYNADFLKKTRDWKKEKVFIQFLPSYSPQLNIIEQVWKHCKHFWIKVKSWSDKEKLKKEVWCLLKGFGKEYKINFKT